MSGVKRILRALGKSDRKLAAVFAATREGAARSVRHLRAGTDLPIRVFSLEALDEGTAAQCERVIVRSSAIVLWLRAQRELWPHWMALTVAEWTGLPGKWPLKLAPLTIPPFRAIFLNESGDFLRGTPRKITIHAKRRLHDAAVSAGNRCADIALGAALYCFAFVAQFYSPLSRFAFRRIRGARTLDLDVPAGSGSDVARISYRKRVWDGESIRRLAESTDARWMLFQRDDYQCGIEDLKLPFSESATFAVARQTAVRSWRKLLFATAPFRALQADELTPVFAPVSPQILVDRAKLLALGIPSLASSGSNWFILFWKAAAAGWKSYSVGGAAKPTELEAVPLEEAEFVKMLLAEPDLRQLAPRDPDLARGAIARAIAHAPGFRGLPRVLVVSPYLPYPLSHGGAVRIYNLCRVLADRVDFVLACFREKADVVNYAKLHEVFREVYVVDIDEKRKDPALPKQVSHYESASMRALVADLCARREISLLQIEYTQLAAYREAAPQTPAILVDHDLTFTLYRQLAERDKRPEARSEYERWLAFERERLRAYDAVWTMSELDRERAVAEGADAVHTFAIPNGVDLRRFNCPAKTSAGMEILYVGSFRHLPNYLGFEELRARIMPRVWRDFPDARLRVVAGPEHEKHWPGSRELDPRIVVHGFVEDLVPMYTEATLVAVPLPVSAGTNIKLMEALSTERAVVTTPVGCAGLELVDGCDALIRDLGEPFAAAICDLLGDAVTRERIAAKGRETAEARFGWESIAKNAYESYRRAMPGVTGFSS